jgi:hypothetical protein
MLEGDRWKRRPVAGEEWRRTTPAGCRLLSAQAAQRQSLIGETVNAPDTPMPDISMQHI